MNQIINAADDITNHPSYDQAQDIISTLSTISRPFFKVSLILSALDVAMTLAKELTPHLVAHVKEVEEAIDKAANYIDVFEDKKSELFKKLKANGCD